MKKQDEYQSYLALCQEIRHHDKLYYVENKPAISDEEYDHLYKKLQEIEKAHPEWVEPTSPTQRIGETLTSGFATVKHQIPMLSLANTYSKEELADFIKRIKKLVGDRNLKFSCELKMDGVAVSVYYEKGCFVRGVTRGDGRSGDDVTANIKTIEALPLCLEGYEIPEKIEVRGEVFMTHQVFKAINEQRQLDEEPLWANPRNAAAGSLKLLDPREVAKRNLSVVFYGIADASNLPLNSQYESHAYLRNLGLPTLQQLAQASSLEDIWAFAEKVKEIRPKLAFDIDGIVVKVDDLQEHKRLGNTGKNPRWAVAYKFASEKASTHIRDITVQVGRTGVLTPVAELEPVTLAGSKISRATLHNEDEVLRKDIRIGDLVFIEKGGDVIPKVVGVDLSKRSSRTIPWEMPKSCPSCGTNVVKVTGEVAVRCPNKESCPEQQLQRIIFFAGKHAMDIDSLGEKVANQLIQLGFVKHPSDIYTLTEKEVSQLKGFKDKAIHNLLNGIEKSKDVSLPRFIMALGIKHVGAGIAELLATKAGSIQELMKMSPQKLQQIEGIGEKVAHSLAEYFADESYRKEIDLLLAHGVHPHPLQVKSYQGHPFEGKTFVLTGTLKKYTRQSASTLIKERGGKVTDSISKKTDYVIVGEFPGSKLEKAYELGIPILSESEFEKKLS